MTTFFQDYSLEQYLSVRQPTGRARSLYPQALKSFSKVWQLAERLAIAP
ncbi:hypothetical protein IQ254_20860 [Nodosilinea sp. LEGE 07088]|nr:hypothetical protein [Nodosilinea sp. LEGE 07088]MBE9139617.1 hypothetical protein [Nodosilinea sp. LEGE 07088]